MRNGVLIAFCAIFFFGLVQGVGHSQVFPGMGPVSSSGNGTSQGVFSLGSFGSQVVNPPTLYVGWVASHSGATIGRDRHLPGLGLDDQMSQMIPYTGLWLGAKTLIGPVEHIGIELEGGVLVSHGREARWEVNPPGEVQPFSVEGFDSGYLQGMTGYRVFPAFEIMGGFRWEPFSVKLQDVVEPESFDDFQVNTYLPLVGVRLRSGSVGQQVTVQVIGAPIVWGNLRFHNWFAQNGAAHSDAAFSSGGMFEATAECTVRFLGCADLSFLGKWQHVHAKTNSTTVISSWPSVDGGEIEWLYSRNVWTFALGISAPF